MGVALQLQSTTVKGYANDIARGRVVVFTSAGVDIYRTIDWTRVAWASLPNVTCGTINGTGIYIGTSDAGVWMLPLTASGASNGSLISVFGSGASVSFSSGTIADIAGAGTALAVIAGSTLYYLPTRFTAYEYSGSLTPAGVRIDGTDIVILSSGGSATINSIPTGDWDDTGSTNLQVGALSTGLSFDGDDYIITPIACSAMSIFTVKGKVTPSSFTSSVTGTPRRIVTTWKSSGSTRWAIGCTSDGVIEVYFNDGTTAIYLQGPTLSIGTEYKFAVTYDGTTLKLYVDDELVGSTDTTLVADTYDYARIGIYLETSSGDDARGFKGVISQISFWNSAQDATEIQDLEPVGTESDLLAYYPLDEGTGSTAYDGGDNENDAPITGATWDVSPSASIQCVALAGDIFIGTDEGLFSYDGSTATDHSSLLGSVKNVTAIWPETGATASSGFVAYGTSDGSENGEFGIFSLAGTAANRKTESGDTDHCWIGTNANDALHDDTLGRYRLVAEISPGAAARSVRRDWSLYAEITDALGGIQADSVALKVNGQAVSPTTSAITNGYAVAYTPGSSSGYAARVNIELSGTDADGNTVSKTWTFVTATAPAAAVTDSTPPNVVCTRDLGLDLADAEEVVDGVNVVWLEQVASPLIATQVQAERIGQVEIDGATYDEWRLSATFLPVDADGLATRSIQQGQSVALTVPALSLDAQPCRVLAKQRVSRGGLTNYRLIMAHYEEV